MDEGVGKSLGRGKTTSSAGEVTLLPGSEQKLCSLLKRWVMKKIP